jgi:hypothetical protein
MSEITPILPVQVVSNYTRKYPVGDSIATTVVKHTQVGDGPIRVTETTYTTYNARGESVESPREVGKHVDISA